MKSHYRKRFVGAAMAGLALIFSAPGARAGEDRWIGEIMYTIANSCPSGWLPADGRLLNGRENQALWSLLSNTFGGNPSANTFALPDLRGRTVVGATGSTDTPLGALALGAAGGAEEATLEGRQLSTRQSGGNLPARGASAPTAASGTITGVAPVWPTPIATMPPWIGLTACIATTGFFPQRD